METNNDSNTQSSSFESYKSPTEMFKGRLVSLLFECINHHSRAIGNKEETYAFARKAWDLSILMERYTPSSKRKELKEWMKQLKGEIEKTRQDKDLPTPNEKAETISNLEYTYAEEVHQHNQRTLIISPIIEVDVEGDLDISDENILDTIRLGTRKDDGRIVSK